jgi:methylmalonyl-CoA mutase cobalamin-binding domain/chain
VQRGGNMPLTLRQRTSVVVFAGQTGASDRGAQALASSLHEAGVEILYLGREASARRIATCAVDACADAVEVCVAGGGAVVLLRDLLRELKRLDRRGVSIVVHRVQ